MTAGPAAQIAPAAQVATAAPGSTGSHRLTPAHYEPARVPAEVLRHSGHPNTLGVGRAGKIGLLELSFAHVGGRTELVGHYQKSPLQIMRPLYFDPGRPDLAITYLMSTGGGIVQADRLRMDLRCGPGSAVHLTTQAATKVYRMDTDYATQLVNLTAEADSYVEYLPEPTIPYRDSRFYQRTVITVAPSATVLAGETLSAGRLARGERNAFTPLAPAAEVAHALRGALADSGLVHGVSVLPHDCGAWLRVLGSDSPAVTAAVRRAWDAVRRLLLGVPAPVIRKS